MSQFVWKLFHKRVGQQVLWSGLSSRTVIQEITVKTTLLLALLATVTFLQAAESSEEKIPRAVEYVGRPESERGKSFVEFLRKNFTEVHATSLASLKTAEDAVKAFSDSDVLVVDTSMSRLLPPAYSKPMVLLSGQGVRTAEGLGAKLDWL